MGIEPRHDHSWGGDPGAQKHTHTTPGHPDGTSKPMISSTPASPCETVEPFHGHGAHTGFQHGSLKFSVERRSSSRTFRYGYLVTT